jgi:SAM-dependent methyltransferase
MHGLSATDGRRAIDWGCTSADYAAWRPDYPNEFYDRLAALGIAVRGQQVLDLATGVGFLALNFARRGAKVTAIDISAEQIDQARVTALANGLDVDFRVCPAEATGLPDSAFDVVTASQCWLYFDCARMVVEVRRLLRPGGVLMLSHFCWLPRLDEVARRSEELVLRFNPDWSAANWSGDIPDVPAWSVGHFEKVDGFVFDAAIPFTRESWRGRMRACRGVGASLTTGQVADFDAAHARLLAQHAPAEFTVLHRIDCFVLRPRPWSDRQIAGANGRS